MKRDDQSLEQLTRRLMTESIEQPSANLNSRIMGLLKKEQQAKKKTAYSESLPNIESIVWGMVAYLIIIGTFIFLNGGNMAEMKETIASVVGHNTICIATLSAGGLLFSLCLWMDNRRKWRKTRS